MECLSPAPGTSGLASSVCWSLQCLVSALTKRDGGGHFFFLNFKFTCSVALWGGREGCCKQITLACARSASATLGLPPVHSACSLSAHTAQTLGCCSGNHPRRALGCLHLPGLSRSGSGTQVLLRGTEWVDMPFPGPCSSDDQVFGEHRRCDLSPQLGFLGVQLAHLLRRMSTIPNPKKS